jgi:hypothetical protein
MGESEGIPEKVCGNGRRTLLHLRAVSASKGRNRRAEIRLVRKYVLRFGYEDPRIQYQPTDLPTSIYILILKLRSSNESRVHFRSGCLGELNYVCTCEALCSTIFNIERRGLIPLKKPKKTSGENPSQM